MANSLDFEQIGFYFQIGVSLSDDEYERVFPTQEGAYAEIQRAFENSGLASQEHAPLEVCELSGEMEDEDGLPAFSVWFHSARAVPLDDVRQLKALCEAAYQKAALATGVSACYLRAERFQQWIVRERSTVEAL